MDVLAQVPRNIHDVAVVGGGFAGAVATRELSQGGKAVVLVEARDRLGGRTWRRSGALPGLDLEMGGTWIDPRQPNSWAEAQRYSATVGTPVYGAPPNVWLVGGHLRQGIIPIAVEAIGELEQVVRVLGNAAARIDPGLPLQGQGVADLDVSIDDFLGRLDVSTQTREIFSVYLGAYCSAYSQSASMLHIARRIAAAGSFAEFIMSGASYPLINGTTALLSSIVDDAPASVLLEAPVIRVEQDDQHVIVITGSGALRCRVAIMCVPANVLKDIDFDPPLSPEKMAVSQQELACTGIKVWALIKGDLAGFSACGRGAGLDMIWSEQPLKDDGTTLLVGYGPDADMIDPSDTSAVQTAIAPFLPDVEVVATTGHDWRHDPYAQETWAVFRPGQISRYEPHIRAREKRLIFGGSHTALRWPGFIDGAIESGYRTAREACAVLDTGGSAL